MEHPAGEADDGSLRVDFDRRLKLEFHGSRITSDAGLLAYRELDDALGLTDLAGSALSECRRGRNTRHLLTGLLRQSVFGRLAGYEDVNDADRLAHDPAMRAVVDRGGLDRRAASTSQMGRFETGWLASDINRAALADLSGAWIDRVHARRPQTTIVLDMDSSVSETHGAQEGSAYNGHFGCTCYHPLCVFNQFGDLERCGLRPGNVHSAADWRDVLEPVVARYRHRMKRRYFRGDAAYANPGIYEFLEAEGYKYTIRLPTNAVLQQRIGWLLKRPIGRPPNQVRRYYASFSYQAASWNKARRVVDDDATRPAGEDRRQDRPPWPVDYLPNGRGDGAWCSVPENPGRYRGAPAVAARPMLEDQRQTGPIWLLAGDLRPEAGSRVQILAHTAIVGQSARLQPSSQRFTVAERPVWWLVF
jgi:hypothetical protein